MTYTQVQKRAAILREIKQRERVYPRLVAAGKMTDGFAASQIEIMKAIAEDYPEPMPEQGGLDL